MSKIDFLFGLHFDQPLGTEDSVLEEIYQNCYLPFFKLMEKYPSVKFSFHFGGTLYDWFLKAHPEFIKLIKSFVFKRQAEALGGAHYNPILPLIPDQDKLGQIKLQSDFIQEHFGLTPRGAWITENSFEPHLVKILKKAGIEYIPLLDSTMSIANPNKEYFTTEEEGQTLSVFPIIASLVKIMPKCNIDDLFSYFKTVINRGKGKTVVLFDQGEKYGAETHVWLEDFIRRLADSPSNIKTQTFSDYIEENMPSGKVYPNVSSSRNLLMQSSALDNVHKKMLYVSSKNKAEKDRLSLYKAQSGLGYLFGIARPKLRAELYKHLIVAECFVDISSHENKSYTEVVITDFNKDGLDEVLMSNSYLSVYFAPQNGGAIFEIDYKPKNINLLNTLGQWSLNDHFFDTKVSLDHLQNEDYHECGDFIGASYSFFPQRKKSEVGLSLSRSGQVIDKNGVIVPIKVMKKISLLKGQSIINIDYEITSLHDEEAEIMFGPDFNLSFLGPRSFYEIDSKLLNDKTMLSLDILHNVGQVKIVDVDSGYNVSLMFEKKSMLVRFPYGDEQGIYQNSVLIPVWQIKLGAKSNWTNRISLRLESL